MSQSYLRMETQESNQFRVTNIEDFLPLIFNYGKYLKNIEFKNLYVKRNLRETVMK
jgi:hypothetical protein